MNKLSTCLTTAAFALLISGCTSMNDVATRPTADGTGLILTASASNLTDCQIKLDTYAGHHVQMVREQQHEFLSALASDSSSPDYGMYSCAAIIPNPARGN